MCVCVAKLSPEPYRGEDFGDNNNNLSYSVFVMVTKMIALENKYCMWWK